MFDFKSKALFTILLLHVLALGLVADVFSEQEQFERQKEIFETLSKDPTKNIKNLQFDTNRSVDSQNEGSCFLIKDINVKNTTLISSSSINKIKNKYINRCNYLSDIKNLTNELNALYVDKGYITSQIYISAQDISSGVLNLEAVEGKVANITPNEPYITNAFLGQKDDYLNIRDIEIAIESINRVPSNNASMKLNPSSKVGYSDIEIINNSSRRIGGSVGIDNHGSKRTGRAQISSRVNIDNILGINDVLNLNYNTSNKHYAEENSIGNGFEYSFPIQRATFSLSQRNSRFDQFNRVGANTFLSEGRTKTYTFDTQYKLYHDQKHRVGVGASLSNYRTRNYFADVYLESSSYRLSKFTLMSDYLYQIPGFYTSINLSYSRGIDLFNNYHSTSLNDEYEYFNLSISAMKDFNPFRYTLNLYSQYSNDNLFGSDRISIGGVYSVRGFNKEGLSGNSGFYARNELSYNSSHALFGGMNNSLFVALDTGAIREDESSYKGHLVGWAFGNKFYFSNLEATLQYSMPIYKKDVTRTQNTFNFSIRAKF